jgi:hypothetical protein
MDGGRGAGVERLEERLAELEKLVEELEGVPDSEVVGVLDRAVALLEEINGGIEAGLLSAEGEARELGDLMERVDFGPFDAALKNLEGSSDPENPPNGSRGEG